MLMLRTALVIDAVFFSDDDICVHVPLLWSIYHVHKNGRIKNLQFFVVVVV